ncbi:MAG: S49 family peptidase, partial [Saprospiraceae bacterium]
MRQFFKFIFASCLGTFLAIGLVFFLFFAIANSFSAKDSGIGKNGVLLLDFEAPMPERTDNIMTGQFTFEPINAIGVHHIKDLIKKAETDDDIKGIVFKASLNTSGGPVTHSIIREALRSFRDSTDKFVYSYADFYTNNTYLLAAASDSIFINPNGIIDINGYGALLPFFTDMLDRIGVKMNVFYAGNYKSATEPFRRNGMSPENREQTREFLTDNFDLYMDEVSRERNINESAFRSLINEL